MAAVRVVVVSDSHLSRRTPEASEQWDAVVDHVAGDSPALVVHAGDVSADGGVRPDDLAFAHDRLRRLPAPWAVVPGNHDVGEVPLPGVVGATVDDARLRRFRAAFGSDHFAVTLGRWRVIGLDALLLGAGGDDESEQWEWLDGHVAGTPPGTPLAVVLHKPLVPAPGDEDRTERYVPPTARARLLSALAAFGGRLVVSGHVHQVLRHTHGGLDHVWAPTTWAVLPDGVQPRVGRKVPGVVELTLHDDGRVDVATPIPRGMRPLVLGVDIDDPYDDGHDGHALHALHATGEA